MTPIRPAARVADFLVRRYGIDRVAEIVRMFEEGRRSEEVAAALGVKRQIVWRWRRDLGVAVRRYVPHPEVEAIVRPIRPRADRIMV